MTICGKHLRKIKFLFLVQLIISCSLCSSVKAIDTFFCGPPPLVADEGEERVTIWWPMGPRMSNEEVNQIHQLANQGVEINYRILWWGEPEFEDKTILDVYYNDMVKNQLTDLIDYNFNGIPPDFYPTETDYSWGGLDPNKLWAVTLGDEEPAWIHQTSFHDTLAGNFNFYSSHYLSETGFQLKPVYDMNQTEYIVFSEWLNEKNNWVYNFIYDHIKSQWPHLKVFQFMIMNPVWGIPDLWAAYELKADGHYMDCYYAHDNPWLLYEANRRYKGLMPEKDFQMTLWGTIWNFSQMEGGELVEYHVGSFEQMRREAWLSYLSGVDAIGWFTWAPIGSSAEEWSWGQLRTDTLGKRLFEYVNRLNVELEKLPTLQLQPQVLGIVDELSNFAEKGIFADGTFLEYDIVTQRTFAKTALDLSAYKLLIIFNCNNYEETVLKLNDYVTNGGNLLILGGTIPQNVFENGTRITKFPFELHTTQSFEFGHIKYNSSKPNPIDFELDYEALSHQSYALLPENATENYQPIGEHFQILENGTAIKLNSYPLVLYKNSLNPSSGSILYWGISKSSQTEEPDENQKYTRLLYRKVLRAYAKYLNLTGAVSTNTTENCLMTQGQLADGTILAGITNMLNENRPISYSLDLDRFSLPPGNYWVHSLDANETLGQFSSTGPILSFSAEVIANGTRLLLISQTKPQPAFSVDIFPPVPTKEEVEPTTSSLSTKPSSYHLLPSLLSLTVIITIEIIILTRKRVKG
ncbi:MAG: hypothetical protein GF308_13435 [Candidatus Heimdallarchaeota archaeon]|nr:hypothetical protein [Candidatus Heimdallarchaeota archaeon]